MDTPRDFDWNEKKSETNRRERGFGFEAATAVFLDPAALTIDTTRAVKYRHDPANPPRFSPAERARLDAMTQEEIDRAAEADAENPPMTDDELARAAFARDVRMARENTGLSQPLFAERFHITLSRLRDWERARFKPDSVAAAYIKTILANPKLVERALTAPSRNR